MKNVIFLAFLLGMCSFMKPVSIDDIKALSAENKVLTKKIDSLFYSARSEIQSKIKKTDRLVKGAKEPKYLLPVYQENCDYFTKTLDKTLSLKSVLKDQMKLLDQAAKDLKGDKSASEQEKNQLGQILKDMYGINFENAGKLKEIEKNTERIKKSSCKEVIRLQKMIAKEGK
jgi:hypothetical protein